jgi:hypothetical protein
MIPWEHTRPQAGLCATWMAEPLTKPSAGADAALSERPWQRRAVPPAAVETCSAVLEMDFSQSTTGPWGLDDGFPQAARASGTLEMRFLQGTTGPWGVDDGFPQAARASGVLERRFLQVTTGSWALEIDFPGGTTNSAGLKNGFLGAARRPERPQERFFSSLDEPQPLTR